MSDTQPEALRLAEILEHPGVALDVEQEAAAELRRLHALNAELLRALDRIAKWDEHTTGFAVDYGSNGVRDLYRGIARAAINKATGE